MAGSRSAPTSSRGTPTLLPEGATCRHALPDERRSLSPSQNSGHLSSGSPHLEMGVDTAEPCAGLATRRVAVRARSPAAHHAAMRWKVPSAVAGHGSARCGWDRGSLAAQAELGDARAMEEGSHRRDRNTKREVFDVAAAARGRRADPASFSVTEIEVEQHPRRPCRPGQDALVGQPFLDAAADERARDERPGPCDGAQVAAGSPAHFDTGPGRALARATAGTRRRLRVARAAARRLATRCGPDTDGACVSLFRTRCRHDASLVMADPRAARIGCTDRCTRLRGARSCCFNCIRCPCT